MDPHTTQTMGFTKTTILGKRPLSVDARTKGEDVQSAIKRKARKDRLLRNDMERERRVRYNNHLMDLAMLVPTIINARKRLDKTSILRLTVNYLRLYKEIQNLYCGAPNCPKQILSDRVSSLLLESLGGFLLVVDTAGVLLYASTGILKHLGLQNVDLLGQSVKQIIHPEDHCMFTNLLRHKSGTTRSSHSFNKTHDGGLIVPKTGYLRMLARRKGQADSYETVQMQGCLKLTADQSGDSNEPPDGMLMAVVRLVHSEINLEVALKVDSPPNQWISYVTIEGMLLQNDHRAALITGFTSAELRGRTVYEIMHHDDIPYAINSHKQLIESNGSIIPWTLLRLTSKSGDFLYTYITSHMVLDPWTKKPRYLISLNHDVRPSVGERLLKKQRERFEKLTLDSHVPTSIDDIENWSKNDILNLPGPEEQDSSSTSDSTPQMSPQSSSPHFWTVSGSEEVAPHSDRSLHRQDSDWSTLLDLCGNMGRSETGLTDHILTQNYIKTLLQENGVTSTDSVTNTFSSDFSSTSPYLNETVPTIETMTLLNKFHQQNELKNLSDSDISDGLTVSDSVTESLTAHVTAHSDPPFLNGVNPGRASQPLLFYLLTQDAKQDQPQST